MTEPTISKKSVGRLCDALRHEIHARVDQSNSLYHKLLKELETANKQLYGGKSNLLRASYGINQVRNQMIDNGFLTEDDARKLGPGHKKKCPCHECPPQPQMVSATNYSLSEVTNVR
jgi:hypothetical protein